MDFARILESLDPDMVGKQEVKKEKKKGVESSLTEENFPCGNTM